MCICYDQIFTIQKKSDEKEIETWIELNASLSLEISSS
jgi:hypothetical protein